MNDAVIKFISMLQTNTVAQPDQSAVRESGVEVSVWDRDFGQGVMNPDALVARRPQLINEMRDDDALGAYMDMKKSARLCTNWDVKAASEDDQHTKHRDYILDVIKRMPGSLKDKLRGLMTAMEYGYAISNKPLYEIPSGQFAGLIGVQDIKTKEPHRYRFRLDEFRNIVGLMHEEPTTMEWKPLDHREFIIYTYRPEFSNPYGRSDFRRAFRWWNSKKWAAKMWDMYLERFAGGFLDVTYTQNKQNAQEHGIMQKFVTDVSTPRTGVMHSDVYEVKINEPSGRGQQTFDEAIKSRNIYMARAVLLPDLLGFSSAPGGAFALGKKHFDVFLWVLEDLGRDLEETIMGEQFIKPLIDMNFGVQDMYPQFKFDPMTDEQKVFVLTQLFAAVKEGVIKSDIEIENEVRKILNLPERDPDDVEDDDNAITPTPETQPDDGDGTAADESTIKIDAAEKTARTFSAMQARRLREPTKFERKVDVGSIIETTGDLTPAFVETWSDLLLVARDKLVDTITKRGIIESGDTKAVEALTLARRMDMEKALHRFMLQAMLFGALQAQKEMSRKPGKLSASRFQIDTAIKVNQMFDFFKDAGLLFVPKGGLPAASIAMKRRAFFITGVESEKILSQAKQVILTGMERNSLHWTERELKRLFDGFVKTGAITDGKIATQFRVNTIARTNFTKALNEGRRVRFNDPDVRSFIQAYQYSAILDEFTTDYCSEMDKRVLKKEEMELEGFPPAHYNCRSFVVPVTEGEEFSLQRVPTGVRRSPGF